MDSAIATASASSPITFRDGLGQRRQAAGAGNQSLDVLILHEELSAVASFEAALRERIERLAGFEHPSYARVRGVGRLTKGPARLVLASDHVPGVRLSELLRVAEQRLIPLEFDAAFYLIRQLVPAIGALHRHAPDASHGALAIERIIITPTARVVVVEYVLGPALEQLRFSRERYWEELRTSTAPAGDVPHFDQRTDIMQAGTVALALILGRPLGNDEYHERIADIVEGVRAISPRGLEPLAAGVHAWLCRALQLDAGHSFASAVEAQVELDALTDVDEDRGRKAFESFLARYEAAVDTKPVTLAAVSGMILSTSPALAAPLSERPAIASPVPEDPQPAHETFAVPSLDSMATEPPDRAYTMSEEDVEQAAEHMPQRSVRGRRGRVAVVAAVLIALASGATLVARRYLAPAAMGTLAVTANRPGLSVSIDGETRGSTPLTIDLTPGSHVLEIHADGQVRTVPVSITAGAQVAQYIELSEVGPDTGQLQIRTEPAGATVFVDGERRGVSPMTVEGLVPGAHTILLENGLGSVKENITIEAGATMSLVVPLSAPPGIPVSGWISIAAPVDVQVYEHQRLLGSSRSDRIMVSVGRHELDIVNEALGYRATRTVQVMPGSVTPVRLDWPKGSMALNALPWAEVWVDGVRMGETPLGNVSVPIGPHEIVFKHPEFGEQRHTITVALTAPARVSADMRK